jgi:predicted Rossmann fold nucleotide-binding protein DprA/Smf involved in DNA uptake
MKKLQSKLQGIVKSLAALSQKVEKIIADTEQVKIPPKIADKVSAQSRVKSSKRSSSALADKKLSVLDTVLETIKRSRNGATVANLRAKTGLNPRQLSNALYKLSKKGSIKSPARGTYVKA